MLKDTGRRFETEELNEFPLDGFMMERVQPTCRLSPTPDGRFKQAEGSALSLLHSLQLACSLRGRI